MNDDQRLFCKIEEVIRQLDLSSISEERKKILKPLMIYIQEKLKAKEPVNLNFICTHNSRRSHLSQVWGQTLAAYYEIRGVYCYSGGTEATAVFPMVVETLKDQGFEIQKLADAANPVYSMKFGANQAPVVGFSKAFDHSFNPERGFAAVMTCSQADEGCPLIPGADQRFPVTFEDPKAFDGGDQQEEKYKERSLQIATELSFIFSQIQIQ